MTDFLIALLGALILIAIVGGIVFSLGVTTFHITKLIYGKKDRPKWLVWQNFVMFFLVLAAINSLLYLLNR